MTSTARWARFGLYFAIAFTLCMARADDQAPTPGQNINMVSGTTFPGGDPFLQRQNEPAIAVSTRNPLHLLAGANDYRAVNIPGLAPDATGDAWLGVFKSFNGGATWTSTLLPGYPQDKSAQGLSSPLHGFTTASDPLVRAAPAGLFYYSGIAFNRGTNLGVVFVSRSIDLNNIESGDSIQYLGTVVVDSGTAGQFLDKPWIAVGLPTGGTCTIQVPQGATTVTQTVPAAPVYLLWARFTGSTSSKIMFSQSLDCGATWSNPTKLSESNSINQGTTIGVSPNGLNLYVAWRRFATSSQPDAIVTAVSTNAGKTFGKAVDAVDLQPFSSTNPNVPSFFDQGNDLGTFRTNAFPALAVDGSGRVYLAWSQRGFVTTGLPGQARIAMSTSTDGLSWSTPFAIDNGALNDRGLNVLDTFRNTLTLGHQVMPQMTVTGGKVMVGYYDQREDHTVGLFTPNSPFAPDANGLFYQEARGFPSFDELPGSPQLVFTPFLTDDGLTQRRHTIDVVVAQANPSPTPTFTTARVSQYKFGLRNDLNDPFPEMLEQLQVNPPNLPMFAQGTLPFIGDYIDVAGLTFLPPAVTGSTWQFNTSALRSPVHYITWTDDRDVVPPLDLNWAHYTPPGPNCTPGLEGDRNQNIYVSRITQGLLVTSPQNSKPLSTSLQRAFVVLAQNFTNFNKSFRMTIPSQPTGGFASFTPGTNNPPNPPTPPSPVTTSLDISVAAHSGVARPVFATSSNPTATITVNVDEITAPGGSLVSGGLSSFVVLNPDPSAPSLVNPSGGGGGDIGVVELYNPTVTNPTVTNPDITNPTITNPNITNPTITNPSITNPTVTNPDITNPTVTNPTITNAQIADPTVTNPTVTNPTITNGAISDATYTLTNSGNTSASYTVKLVGNNSTNTNLQLIATKSYLTPAGLNCQLIQQSQSILLDNVVTPPVQDPTITNFADPTITNPTVTNSTLALAPGETALITLRGFNVTTDQLQTIATQIAPIVVAQAANTNDSSNTPKFAAPLFITTTGTLPSGTVGVPYSGILQSIGGTSPLTWTVSSGALPNGLSLDPALGTISGTPIGAGTFGFTVQVTDSSSPPKTNFKSLSVTINKANTTTTITSVTSSTSLVGQPITMNYNVTANLPSTAPPPTPSGTVTVSDGLGDTCNGPAPSGSCTLTPAGASAPMSFNLTATYSGDSNFNGSTSAAVPHSVAFYTFNGFLSPLATAGSFAFPSFSGTGNLGSAVPIKWQLQDPATGAFITDTKTTQLLQAVFTSTCVGSPTGPTILLFSPTNGATGGSTFRYDFTNNQFIFNWDTSTGVTTGAGCYTILLQLNDKSPLKVTSVQLK